MHFKSLDEAKKVHHIMYKDQFTRELYRTKVYGCFYRYYPSGCWMTFKIWDKRMNEMSTIKEEYVQEVID